VGDWSDNGLASFALDPGFEVNGLVYVFYSVDMHHYNHFGTATYDPAETDEKVPHFGRVTRYKVENPLEVTTVIPDSRYILIGEDPLDGFPFLQTTHSCADMKFAEDGSLIISCGDGAHGTPADNGGDEEGGWATDALAAGVITEALDVGSYRSQSLGAHTGKLLRVNPVTGDGYESNPFYDASAPSSAASRTWALGFRNPWRFNFRPGTGSHLPSAGNPGVMVVGDVGSASWEEINVVTAPAQNFGWPIMEGYDHNWAFYQQDVPPNLLTPNPLYGTDDCEKEYFDFRDLFILQSDATAPHFPNPCDEDVTVPAEYYPTMEKVPAIIWSHDQWNLPTRTMVGYIDEAGNRVKEALDESDRVAGSTFDGHCSIGGVFYEGENFPEEYRGLYFHADYSGWIRTLEFDDNHELMKIDTFHGKGQVKNILYMTVNPHDECIYYVNLQDHVRKICYGGNPAPVAEIEVDVQYGASPLVVQLDGSASIDQNDTNLTYSWDFGDGEVASGAIVSHTFESATNAPTPYEVTLKVTDSEGAIGTTAKIISLNNTPPQIDIQPIADGDFYALTDITLYDLSADVEDAEHDAEEMEYLWEVFFHHNVHFHPQPDIYTPTAEVIVEPAGCEEEDYWYRVGLTVTDPAGLSTYQEKEIYPYCGPDIFELIELRAEEINGQVKLTWETTYEDNLTIFEIEKTKDYKFRSIATVQPLNTAGSYTYVDEDPLIGTNYYRIKGYRTDGVFDYSNQANITFLPYDNLAVFPNPTSGDLNLVVKNIEDSSIILELYATNGQRVLRNIWASEQGQAFQKTISVSELPNGVYFYRLWNGEQELVGKVEVIK